jgi:hypothetical protein
VGSRAQQQLLVVECATGAVVDRIPFAEPGPMTACGDRLIAFSAGRPMLVDPAARSAKPFLTPAAEKAAGLADLTVTAVALREDGTLFVADGRSHTVRGIGPTGTATVFGKPGGAYTGAWQTERMVSPSGVAILGDRLWVAEDRTQPKRAVAWDLAKRTVVRQVFGNPAYGGSGAGFDPASPTTWAGEGALWTIDPVARTAKPRSILGNVFPEPFHWRWIRRDGRTWLLGFGGMNHLHVLNPDGTLRPVAAWSSCHQFSRAYEWSPPEVFATAFKAAYPDDKWVVGTHGKPNHGPGVVWVDRNGDAQFQGDEFDFSGKTTFAHGGWGHDSGDLTIRLPIQGTSPAILTLEPESISERGVPLYPRLEQAIAKAAPLRTPKLIKGFPFAVSSSTSAGDLVVLGEPMTCWAPDGTQRWSYRNDWCGVHGSHHAPLPQVGVLQGALFVLGMAPIDAKTDAFIINGNHGRFFALTSDGMYLDEMFNDTRVAQTRDAMLVGGECFGGMFGKGSDGTFWLQTGGDGYRLYRVGGLDKMQRAAGEVTVTGEQLLAAQRRAERLQGAVIEERSAVLAFQAKPPGLDGQGQGWSGAPITWGKEGSNQVRARLAHDASSLYLRFEVYNDRSPWVNNGADWTLLFKSGDSIDLQLGGDPAADPERKGPVPGDVRLLIAPMGAENVAVLYRHRVPGTKQGIAFASPWRTETVDEVARLPGAKIVVRRQDAGYVVEAAVPLAELRWAPKPGATYKADLGAISGDDAGTINLFRNYWSNQATGLVNDVPGEIMLTPALWGNLTVESP